jgi:hypothetical protein
MPPEGMEYTSDQEELDNLPDWAKEQMGLTEKKIEQPKKQISDKREYTPESIGTKELPENGILVFGSNTEGRHGLGAANDAKRLFGAKQFQARGLQGRSYAIVTKHLPAGKRSVKLESIQKEINDLMVFAKTRPDLKFYVTKLGTNLAGYSISEMKSLFKEVNTSMTGIPENVILPKEFEVRDETKPVETKPVETKTAEEQEIDDLPDWAKEQLGLSKDKAQQKVIEPISDVEIAEIYRDKVEYLKVLNLPTPSYQEFKSKARNLEDSLRKMKNSTKETILEALKCL